MDTNQVADNLLNLAAGFWNGLAALLPKLAAALAIVLVGLLAAKLLAKATVKLLERLGFNLLCERIGLTAAAAKAGMQRTPAEVTGKLVHLFVLLLVLVSAAETLGMDRITGILNDFIVYLPKVLGALFVILVGMFIAHFARQAIQTAVGNMGLEYAASVARLVQVIVFVVTFSLAVGQLDIETEMLNTLFAIVLGCLGGAAAISLGLGTRTVSNNIISGIYVREQLQPGDSVTVGDFSGVVVSVGTVNTVLENASGECLSVPNQQLLQRSFRFQPGTDPDEGL